MKPRDLDEINGRLAAIGLKPDSLAVVPGHPNPHAISEVFLEMKRLTDIYSAHGKVSALEMARFIANAPADIAALIERVEELEAENTRLREVVVELREALETKSEATARAALARAKEVHDG